MKHFLHFCAFLVYATILLTNCKPKSVDPSPATGFTDNNTYFNTRYGSNTNQFLSTFYDSCGAYFVNSNLILFASDSNGTMFIKITNPVLGKNSNASLWTIYRSGGHTMEIGAGNVDLTTFETNNKQISGNYTISTAFDTKYSTHTGTFFNIPFSKYPNYIPNLKSSLGVGLVNMTNIVSSDYFYGRFVLDSLMCFADNTSGVIKLKGFEGKNSFYLTVPQNIGVGNYNFDTLGMTSNVYLSFNNHYGGSVLKPKSGKISISKNNPDYKLIEGEINAVYYTPTCYGPCFESTVTGGTFKIHYK